MLCLKKRRTYSFTQGACKDLPRRSTKEKNGYNEALNIAVTTLPRKHRSREERSSAAGGMVLTVTEDTPADMLAGSMELLVQLPRDHHLHTQRVTVPRSTPMMDLLVQIATAHKLAVSSYTLQAIGERGLVLPHQPNTPIGALDALQVKLLPKQGTFVPRKAKQANQPFETTFRLQVLLPRNQLYVSRVSPKMNLGKILEEVCREKNLDKNKYELRHPANLEETLDLSLSLQDYHLQEVTLYAKQGRTLGAALSSQDIMALQRQEERRRQQAKQSVFGFMFRKSKESSLSIDSLGGRSVSPARSDETGRSVSPLAPPSRPQRKRRPAPKPPVQTNQSTSIETNGGGCDESREKQLVISHSRNSSDSSGYHEASVLSDNPDSNARIPETLPRRSRPPCKLETSRELGQTSQASKSLGNLATASGGGLSHGISSSSISSTGTRKKRAAPPPPQPIARPLSSAISTQALERIVDSEESLTSDIDISKSPSDIAASSKANSDIGVDSKANSDIGVHSLGSKPSSEIGYKIDSEFRAALAGHDDRSVDINERRAPPAPPPARLKPSLDLGNDISTPETMSEETKKVETARVVNREVGVRPPVPKPRSVAAPLRPSELQLPLVPRRKIPAHESAATVRLSNPNDVESHLTETSTDDDGKIDEDLENKDLASRPDLRRAENCDPGHLKKGGREVSAEIAHIAKSDNGKRVESRPLKHVKSLDDIYGLSMSLADEDTVEETASKAEISSSCAVISTIPKCAHLTPNNIHEAARIDSEKLSKRLDQPRSVLEAPKRKKVFRSQSETNDFDVNSVERHPRHLTSHPESFTCAINPNFSGKVANCAAKVSSNEKTDVRANPMDAESEEKCESGTEDYPPFVILGTNWRGGDDFADVENNDSWAPQVIEEGNADRTTETDILLQKVSATLSNSLPSFEEPSALLATETSDDVVLNAVELNAKRSEISADVDDGLRENISADLPVDPIFPEEPKSMERLETKTRESLLSEKNIANASTPNATMSSQQDTSDYVSATGDDLSITDWEYQLPAPPSAFRDNVSPDFDGYDTITLRSVEAFKEPTAAIESRETFEAAVIDSPMRESPIPQTISTEIERVPKVAIAPKQIIDQLRKDPQIGQTEQPKQPQISAESRISSELKKELINESSSELKKELINESTSELKKEIINESSSELKKKLIHESSSELKKEIINESSTELKKEIINELSNKIENGSLPQSNGRITDQDSFRRNGVELSAPKIAPVDNTLSNFTITTYSRQKSLNIFEEPIEERQSVSQFSNSDDKVVKSFATLSRSKSSAQSNFVSGRALNMAEDDSTSDGKSSIVSRAQSVEHIVAAVDEKDFKRPDSKCLFAQNDSLLRRQSMSNGREKSSVVHRSKSYITLANNSKYREQFEDPDVDKRETCGSRDELDDGRFVKSTSVTNLNQESQHRGNEKFSQWRENILKRQEEPSKEKQLQSLQVLKNILPRLKSTQQSEENVADSMNEKEYSQDASTKSLLGADNEPKSNGTTEPEVKSQPEDATTKRYKYTGPPAVSLGSWSERPRVNVQLKMDTDYKFGGNNNASGPKTVVNLNRTSCDRSVEDRPKEITSRATFPKANGVPTISTNGNAANHDRRDSQDLLPKKSTNTTVSGFKKPTLNRVGFPEAKTAPLRTEDKPIVTSVALKKTPVENNVKNHVDNADYRTNGQHRLEESLDDDDVKIDTKPVNFKELTKTFGQEVCLRAKPKRVIQSRHSDYYGAKSEVATSFSSGGRTSFLDNSNRNSSVESVRKNIVSNGAQKDAGQPIKRYTSVVGIQSLNNNHYGTENGDSTTKIHSATMKMNGLMPVVKGFKMQSDPSESRSSNVQISQNRVAVVDVSKKNGGVMPPPPPPTMPIITGVTLKNSTARPKSVPIGKVDTRDLLLESIRSFGGRDKLKSVHS